MDVDELSVKRAKNMVWTAADRYDFEPDFLYYDMDQSPSLYCNTMVGLGYRCLDQKLILPFLHGIAGGFQADLMMPLVLLVLEEVIYQRMVTDRPSLKDLREEFAVEYLKRIDERRMNEIGGSLRQEWIRCLQILHHPITESQFELREIRLSEELISAARAKDQEMIRAIKEVLQQYFGYHYLTAAEQDTMSLYSASGIFKLFSFRNRKETLWIRSQMRNGDADSDEASGKLKTFLTHLRAEKTREENRQFIKENFGPCILPEKQFQEIEDRLCTGIHKNVRLWYAGAFPDHPEVTKQKERNLTYYEEHRRFLERSIQRIADRLRSSIEEKNEPDQVCTRTGSVWASKVYRVKLKKDMQIFRKDEIQSAPDFSVDLLLDASASRLEHQESLVSQAYVLAKSLEKLGIPVQISCFRSISHHTILQRLKGYQDVPEHVFSFYCSGYNRDGLAFRAAEYLMDHSFEANDDAVKRILLILTDASPSDTAKAASERGFFDFRDYEDSIAEQDTKEAVLELRKKGIVVAAVFFGLTRNIGVLRTIFGSSFVRIKELEQLPDRAIELLLKLV